MGNTQPMKRQYRNDMPLSQRQAISAKLKGRTLSQDTRQKISKSMQDYWAKLPLKPVTSTDDNNSNNINE